MEHYLILARSVTYAQRMQRVLENSGVRCTIYRAPRDLTDQGCAYVVRVSARDYHQALRVLSGAKLDAAEVFVERSREGSQ